MSGMADEFEKELLRKTTKRTEIGADGKAREILSVNVTPPQRTVIRSNGCYNCVHFDTGEKFQALYRDCRARDRRIWERQGKSPEVIDRLSARMDQTLLGTIGVWGVCGRKDQRLEKEASDDFTHCKYMCTLYQGRIVISPFSGGGISVPPAELWDRLGEKPPGSE